MSNKCMKCGNVYSFNGTPYCSPAHKRQHERKAKLCATPGKKVYGSVSEAWDYINSRPDEKLIKNNLRPYSDCSCHKIHIGHGADAPKAPATV